jgi:2-dehydropantoate 2-reductase
MLQDVSAGRPTEIDSINGAVARAGRQHGIAVPVNEFIWRLVRAL